MATLEDKILGEKYHNYCSSSEESENDEENSDSEPKAVVQEQETAPTLPEPNKWEGTSTNTGPKGVLKDWQRYKQLENEKRLEDDREKLELMKKLTLTVQSALDEEREAAAREDPDLAELLNDDFLVSYQKQRMQEMMQQTNHNIKFGKLIVLSSGQEFLDAIDKEHKSVTIIVHIYEDNVDACRAMNACLHDLVSMYPNVKFCCIVGSKAAISKQFKSGGVPALLVYKAGNLVGNFVRISDDLGGDFQAEDVQGFLVEHGMIEDKSCKSGIVRNGGRNSDESD